MKTLIFAVHDSALGQYLTPMFMQSRGQVVRSFSDEVNRVHADNLMNQHPEHFRLFALGFYDADSGIMETTAPEFVVSAVDLIQS